MNALTTRAPVRVTDRVRPHLRLAPALVVVLCGLRYLPAPAARPWARRSYGLPGLATAARRCAVRRRGARASTIHGVSDRMASYGPDGG